MKILSMTATFGKLDNETLDLTGGLNIISAPNEWGKSTWCAFLTAMLYGIDTKARTTRDTLAEKEKYAPWSGKPMEGSIRLIHEGRDITIQRRSKGRTPMGEFKAFETETGLSVPELTKQNCGEVLLGVERSVFQRTGFIRFSDLPVNQDEALRRRLNSLVTTGDESGSADLLAKKLKELKNKCRYNRTGAIPEVQNEIRLLESQLTGGDSIHRQLEALEQRIGQLVQRQDALELHRSAMAYYQAQEDRRRVEQAEVHAKETQDAAEELEAQCAALPSRGTLLERLRQGQLFLDGPDPAVEAPAPSRVPMIVLSCVVIASLILAFLLQSSHFWLSIGAIALCALGNIGLLYLGHQARIKQKAREEAAARFARERQETQAAMALWQQQLGMLEELDRARRAARQAQDQLKALLSMARDAAKPDRPDPLDLSREETMSQLRQTAELLQRCRLQQAQLGGQLENLPPREALLARLDGAKQRLGKLEEMYLALDFAQKALEAAMQELQRRFAPRIAQRSGELLSRLTHGRYGKLSIDSELAIESAADTETTLRNPLWRSDGTADQMYLALRLAVWEAIAPDAPLVLDDAFVRFDQQRLQAAMALLKELSAEHQILLFTCQNREREMA